MDAAEYGTPISRHAQRGKGSAVRNCWTTPPRFPPSEPSGPRHTTQEACQPAPPEPKRIALEMQEFLDRTPQRSIPLLEEEETGVHFQARAGGPWLPRTPGRTPFSLRPDVWLDDRARPATSVAAGRPGAIGRFVPTANAGDSGGVRAEISQRSWLRNGYLLLGGLRHGEDGHAVCLKRLMPPPAVPTHIPSVFSTGSADLVGKAIAGP